MTSLLPLRGRTGAGPVGRERLARALAEATFELLPLTSAYDRMAWIPAGTWVAVTASPARGLDATIDLALALEARGYRAIPHVAARMVRDREHLRLLFARLLDGGVDRAFVVGGDSTEPGEYQDGLSLLRAIADLGIELSSVGIACYPEGHPFIPEDSLLGSLFEKAPFAHYATTQLCFDASAISAWIAARRAEGFGLPIQVGVAGAVDAHRLLTVAAKIGVRDTGRFVAKNLGFVGRLLRSGGFYRADSLLDEVTPLFADPVADVRWVHLFTFNQVEATEAWRQRYVSGLLVAEPA